MGHLVIVVSMRESRPEPAAALVLFDIDGTLIRRAGPHHRQVLVEAVRQVVKVETSTDTINTAGMLDQDILTSMLRAAGASPSLIKANLPAVIKRAQLLYVRETPSLRRKVCPGVRLLLRRLRRAGIPSALVTGNLTRIGWHKMELAGLREYFAFGSFAESAKTRAGLAKNAIRLARETRLIHRDSRVSLVGDHPNDVAAARANRVQAVAVGTGVVSAAELAGHSPDVLVPDMRALTVEMFL